MQATAAVYAPAAEAERTTTKGVRSFHAGSTGGWTTTQESSVDSQPVLGQKFDALKVTA